MTPLTHGPNEKPMIMTETHHPLICYRRLTAPRAIGFDLDDTLYDNRPVLERAEAELLAWLHQHYPASQAWAFGDWLAQRQRLVAADPRLLHDISRARQLSLAQGLRQLGYPAATAEQGARDAMACFLTWRNKVDIAPEVHQLLAQLAERWPLFVISNGNADINALGLADYFQFALHAGDNTLMKPASDLFDRAKDRLALPDDRVLFVGDHPVADIIGANRAGWHSAWINPAQNKIQHRHRHLQLPSLEMAKVEALGALL